VYFNVDARSLQAGFRRFLLLCQALFFFEKTGKLHPVSVTENLFPSKFSYGLSPDFLRNSADYRVFSGLCRNTARIAAADLQARDTVRLERCRLHGRNRLRF